MSHDSRRTWEHAVETVLALGSGTLAAVAVLPGTSVPAWAVPLTLGIAGLVTAASVRAGTGNRALAWFCAVFGLWLAGWAAWAEVTRLWSAPVITAWIVSMIACCPGAAHAALGRREKESVPEPGAVPAAPDPEAEARAEMAKFEHMLSEIGCPGVQVLSLAEERTGRVLRLQLPRSGKVTVTTLGEAVGKIEVILRLRPGGVEFTIGEHAGDVVMRLREREVLTEAPRLRPEVRASTINESFAIGVQEDGSVLKLMLRELHLFMVGTTGSGKSNVINVLLAQLSSCVDTVIWVIDMKGGRTVRPWLQPWGEGKAAAPAIDWVATTREEAALMMRAFIQAINERANSCIGGSKITPSSAMPQIILICDEMASLLGSQRGSRKEVGESGTTNGQFIAMAEEGVQLARSEACTSIWATQRGTNDMAGSGTLKSLCKMRIALGVSSESELSRIIPDVSRVAKKALATMATTPGIGLLAVLSKTSQLSKFFWHDHLEGQCSENGNTGCVAACPVYRTAIDTGSIRPRLDPMTAGALGDAYRRRWERSAHLVGVPVPAAGAEADVDTSQFDSIVAGMGDPEEKISPVRRRYRELLASQGVKGATPKWLRDRLEADGFAEGSDYSRETLQRWLREDEGQGVVHQADYGRWVIGPAAETGSGRAA